MVTLYIFFQKNISRPLHMFLYLFIVKLGFMDTFQAVMGYFICHEVMPTRIYNKWPNYGGHNYVSTKKNKGTQGHTLQKEQKMDPTSWWRSLIKDCQFGKKGYSPNPKIEVL
jgi:hypothetical protein